jgi:predicted MPP superfamily phosphohydrolase
VFVAPSRYRLARRTIVLPSLPEGAQSMTILHISDLHFHQRDEKKLRFIQRLAEHPVDFVFITGDMTDGDDGHENCFAALRNLKGRYGTYAVLGAHDLCDFSFGDTLRHMLIPRDRSSSGQNSVERFIAGLRSAGVCTLRNENVSVEVNGVSLRIIGLEDPYINLHNLAAAIDGAKPDEFKVLLVHAPDNVEEVAGAGVHLVLTGHTHGGQVRIPGIGALVTHCHLPPRYASGVFMVDRTLWHLNNGIGVGRYTHVRFFCRPEATLLTLVPRHDQRDAGGAENKKTPNLECRTPNVQ